MFYYLGACLFSLIDCICYRVTHHMDFIKERSRCEYCGEILKWYELIPIISFIILRGKCSYCEKRISIRIFISELSGLILAYLFKDQIDYFLLLTNLYLIALIDYYSQDVYLITIIPIFIIDLFLDFSVERCIGAVMISGIMYLMNLIHQDSFGMGDILLLIPLGYFFGLSIIYIMLLTSILGLAVGIYLTYPNCNLKVSYLPLIPFIFVSTTLFSVKLLHLW